MEHVDRQEDEVDNWRVLLNEIGVQKLEGTHLFLIISDALLFYPLDGLGMISLLEDLNNLCLGIRNEDIAPVI